MVSQPLEENQFLRSRLELVEGKISEEQARFAIPECQKGSGREAVESLGSRVKEAVRPPKTPAKEAASFPQALPKVFEVAGAP